MAEEIIIEEETTVVTENNVVVGGTRKVIVTAVGFGAFAQEQTGRLLTKLVEQGESAQSDTQQRLQEISNRRAETNARVGQELDRRLGSLLNMFNIPSKSDIDELTEKINDISVRIEALNAQANSEAVPTEEVEDGAESDTAVSE